MVKNKPIKRHNKNRFAFLALLVVALAAAVALMFYVGPFHKQPAVVTANQFTKGESSQTTKSSNSTGTKSSADTSTSRKNSSTNSGTNAALLTPTGDFVSDHHPNLSGNPNPNTMSSVCNTTPGASCQISFTKDDIVKSLPGEITDSGGSAYWNWNLQTYGLTDGSWQIQATASLNGETKTASDAQNLEIAE